MAQVVVAVVNVGVGNIQSVAGALECVGAKTLITDDPNEIKKARYVVLPGVGAFGAMMSALKSRGLDQAIVDAYNRGEARILGICLGFQLLGRTSKEHGLNNGIGLLPFSVNRIQNYGSPALKIPHVGFNTVTFSDNQSLFCGLSPEADFYFTHSYWVDHNNAHSFDRVGTCLYGKQFLAAFQVGNLCGVQFHPEKSQSNGLRLLKNFIN